MDKLLALVGIEIAVYLILVFKRQIRSGDEMNIFVFSPALERRLQKHIFASDHIEAAPSYMYARDKLDTGILQNLFNPPYIKLGAGVDVYVDVVARIVDTFEKALEQVELFVRYYQICVHIAPPISSLMLFFTR